MSIFNFYTFVVGYRVISSFLKFVISYVEQTATVSQQTNRKDAKLDDSGQNKSYDVRVDNFDVAFGNRYHLQFQILFTAILSVS